MSDAPKPPEPSYRPEIGGDTPDAPAAASTEPGTASEVRSPRRRGRTVGIVLAVVLGALGALCVGGAGVGFFWYRQVSEPDRSTPTVAVDQYLNATFIARDDGRARLFTCKAPESISEAQSLLHDVQQKERQFGVHIAVSWESLKASTAGDSATVNGVVRLNTTIQGNPQEEIQHWQFAVSHRSGWRVCDARRTD
ncbi:hypothetical protein HC031_05585 [Planosporangium thailandense]|uniref:Mce-associated membrane protein n=1 Tax=Planosporangium thailandense TaxID=765197 RepID=A0ABX0XTP0_9ACTN|nr:hypothetical protein [Planosporangium thailandense]NJC69191.1 hypothetical protein [Planosporangium thailandense]